MTRCHQHQYYYLQIPKNTFFFFFSTAGTVDSTCTIVLHSLVNVMLMNKKKNTHKFKKNCAGNSNNCNGRWWLVQLLSQLCPDVVIRKIRVWYRSTFHLKQMTKGNMQTILSWFSDPGRKYLQYSDRPKTICSKNSSWLKLTQFIVTTSKVLSFLFRCYFLQNKVQV